jgi:hyaluronan synthase
VCHPRNILQKLDGLFSLPLEGGAAADYPVDLLEIICIDDGSKDDTWEYIRRAQSHYPDLIQAIRFPKNQGKREALYVGFTRGQGDYFISVDSDSVIEPGTLKQIVAPMMQNPKIGGGGR